MAEAQFSVSFAGPLVTIQDAGRVGHMRYGVTTSGPMDRLAFEAAQAALGNPLTNSVIEVSLGGLILTCTQGSITLAITGAEFSVEHAGQSYRSWTVLTVQKGDRLSIRAGRTGSWAYLAFAGELTSNTWLNSSATHSMSGFGGGRLSAGQTLHIKNAAVREDRLGDIAQPDFALSGPIRTVIGPQDHHFTPDAITLFHSSNFVVSQSYDRMGMRLEGAELTLKDALSIPSEPILRGSVQVSGDGVPTVLLADHQTTGGYPKIATVLSCETDRLAQYRAGQRLRFSAVTHEEAVTLARHYLTRKADYLAQIAIPRGTLQERLMRENLIHAWSGEDIDPPAP